MRIAQVAPLTEAVPPKLYGGTERVVHWLGEELLVLGHRGDFVCERGLAHVRQARVDLAKSVASRRNDPQPECPPYGHAGASTAACGRIRLPTLPPRLLSVFAVPRGNQLRSSPHCTAGSTCRSISPCSIHSRPHRSFRSRMHNEGRCRRHDGSKRSIMASRRRCWNRSPFGPAISRSSAASRRKNASIAP